MQDGTKVSCCWWVVVVGTSSSKSTFEQEATQKTPSLQGIAEIFLIHMHARQV